VRRAHPLGTLQHARSTSWCNSLQYGLADGLHGQAVHRWKRLHMKDCTALQSGVKHIGCGDSIGVCELNCLQ